MADARAFSQATYDATRSSLHGVAELLLAGPQRRANRSIKLLVTDGGFATGELPGPPWRIGVRGTSLLIGANHGPDGTEQSTISLHARTFADVAAEIGVVAEPPANSYLPASGKQPADVIELEPLATHELMSALQLGDQACRGFAAAHSTDPPTPVLWPEHFDVGITVDEINYGVSPGDETIPVPYAYVGPHVPRAGAFWNYPFGAARPISDLGSAQAIREFFEQGRARAFEDDAGQRHETSGRHDPLS